MTKVLFVLPDLRGGGAERVVLSVLRHLDRSRFSVTLFLIRQRGVLWGEVPDNVTVFCASKAKSAIFAIPCALIKLFWASRSADVLVAGLELNPTYLTYLVGLVSRKPTIGWIHTCFGPQVDRKYLTTVHRILSRYVLQRMDCLVFVSEGAAESMRNWLQAGKGSTRRWRVIHNPFDLMLYHLTKDLKIDTPWEQDCLPFIVAIGRLEAAKGFDILIRAHALLCQEGIRHRVVIFGEGRQRSELENLASQLGVAKSVAMPGFVPDIVDKLKGAAAFVLCSRYEGFGLVLLEAMAAGLPVIAADCPSGPSEVLEQGKYGILIPPEDPRALADALRCVMFDSRLRASLIEAGARRIHDFSPQRVIPEWEHLFSEFGT